MKRMTVEEKRQALQNHLQSNFPDKYFVVKADGRIGHKFAIASYTENGGVNIHSNYMTYEEFNAYLFGYYHCKTNKL